MNSGMLPLQVYSIELIQINWNPSNLSVHDLISHCICQKIHIYEWVFSIVFSFCWVRIGSIHQLPKNVGHIILINQLFLQKFFIQFLLIWWILDREKKSCLEVLWDVEKILKICRKKKFKVIFYLKLPNNNSYTCVLVAAQ